MERCQWINWNIHWGSTKPSVGEELSLFYLRDALLSLYICFLTEANTFLSFFFVIASKSQKKEELITWNIRKSKKTAKFRRLRIMANYIRRENKRKANLHIINIRLGFVYELIDSLFSLSPITKRVKSKGANGGCWYALSYSRFLFFTDLHVIISHPWFKFQEIRM